MHERRGRGSRLLLQQEDCIDPTMRMVINLEIPSSDAQSVDYYKERLMSAVAAMSSQNGTSALELCAPSASSFTVGTNLDVTYSVPLSAAGAANLSAGCGTNSSASLTVPELANLRLPVKCAVMRNGTLTLSAQSAAAAGGPGGSSIAVVIACSVLGALVALVCGALGAVVFVRRRRKRKEELQQVGLLPGVGRGVHG